MIARRSRARATALVLALSVTLAACNSTTRLATSSGRAHRAALAPTATTLSPSDQTDQASSAGGSGAAVAQSVMPATARTAVAARASKATGAPSINVGILVEDFDGSAAAFAIKDSGQGDQQAQAQAVVNYINAHGGMSGRTVVPVFHHNDPSSGTFAEQNQATCTSFTEDHRVFVVTPQNFEMDTLIACLARKGVPLVATDHVFGAWSDQTQMDQYADYLYLPGTMNFTRSRVVVDGLATGGFFDKGAKIGLLYLDSPSITRAVDQTIRPALAAHGLKLTDAVSIAAPSSETDVSNDAAQVSSAVLRFRGEGIDHVFFLEGAGEIPFLFMPQAQAQGYQPRYGLSSYDEPEWLTQNAPVAQLTGAVGVGWIPVLDVADAQDPGGNAASALCMQIMRNAGIAVTSDRSHEHSALGICSTLFFLKAALDTTTSLDVHSLRASVEALGSSYASALTFATAFGRGRHDGAAVAAGLVFDAGCSCFRYTATRWPIP